MQTIRPTDLVRVKRDIERVEGPYAQAGEQGRVEDVFLAETTGCPQTPVWYAKVRIGDVLKTFRLTSLERVERGYTEESNPKIERYEIMPGAYMVHVNGPRDMRTKREMQDVARRLKAAVKARRKS